VTGCSAGTSQDSCWQGTFQGESCQFINSADKERRGNCIWSGDLLKIVLPPGVFVPHRNGSLSYSALPNSLADFEDLQMQRMYYFFVPTVGTADLI